MAAIFLKYKVKIIQECEKRDILKPQITRNRLVLRQMSYKIQELDFNSISDFGKFNKISQSFSLYLKNKS